jgi:glucose-specific phosphotransferase system IIA component
MSNKEDIFAPLNGISNSVSQAKDEVFAMKMLGDGVIISPASNTNTIIKSPVNGVIQSTHDSKHAIGILSEKGNEILIHVGIDTVKLKGVGFKQLIEIGQSVKIGEALLEVDFDYIAKNAPSSDVIVIITNLEEQVIDISSGNVNHESVIIKIK